MLVRLFEDFSEAVRSGAREKFDTQASPETQINQLTRNFWNTYCEWLPVLTGVFQMSMVDSDFYEHWRTVHRRRRHGDPLVGQQGPGRRSAPLTSTPISQRLPSAPCSTASATSGFRRDGDLPGVELDSERAINTLSSLCYRGLYGG